MAAWPVTGALPFERVTASSAKNEAKAAPPPSAVALANFASRSKRKARPGFSAGSVNWAEEAGFARGSRIWAGRQCADARANAARQAIWIRAGFVMLCIQKKDQPYARAFLGLACGVVDFCRKAVLFR